MDSAADFLMSNLIDGNFDLDDRNTSFSFSDIDHLIAPFADPISSSLFSDHIAPTPLGTQSIFPSNNNNNNKNNNDNTKTTSLFDSLDAIMDPPKWPFLSSKTDLADASSSPSWDYTMSTQDPAQLSNSFGSLQMDNTPELSPATTLSTPALHSFQSPYGFDQLNLDDMNLSPSYNLQSPMEGYNTISNGSVAQPPRSDGGFEFDFGFEGDVDKLLAATSQTDFQLFPENASNAEVVAAVATISQYLMTTQPFRADTTTATSCTQPSWENSPLGSDLDYFSPSTSTCTSPSLTHFAGAFDANPIQSTDITTSTNVGETTKKPRRRRVTSEDASRVNEDGVADTEARRYKCSICEKTFSRPFNLRSHRATHDGVRSFSCTHVGEDGTVCGTSFARRHDLERHVQSRHSNVKLFSCKTCGTKCGRSDAYKRHLQRHAACAAAAAQEEEAKRLMKIMFDS
ncbi:hypothetical protein BGZ94_004379 [Podila epigama]|nr:hypothetical protein BGZ94_004379 [Podila epigama]